MNASPITDWKSPWLNEASKWLAEQGYDPAFGARPLKRALQKFVESPLSIKILEGEFVSGDIVEVGVDDEGEAMTFTLKGKKKVEKENQRMI